MALQDRVKEYNQQREQGRQRQQPEAALPEGTVTHIETFTTPIHGAVDGEPVRILGTGNVTGFSPGYLVVGQNGETAWLPMSEVRVIDPNFLPLMPSASGLKR